MNYSSPRSLTLAALTLLLGLAGSTTVSAVPPVDIHIGVQAPPQRQRDYRWERPHRTAIWIPGHHEWTGRRYVWVGGYYSYPPQGSRRWVSTRYSHHQDGYYYRPGHWSN